MNRTFRIGVPRLFASGFPVTVCLFEKPTHIFDDRIWEIASHKSFLYLIRIRPITCFADCSLESAHHFSSRPDWLQRYSRSPFFNPAYRSLSSAICFRSVRCWRTMIPGKVFTRFAKFTRIVTVNDLWFPRRLQELLQALLFFPKSFCFTQVRMHPWCCQFLYHDSASMIVPRFTFFTKNFVICCCQNNKIFCSKCGCPRAFSAKSSCYHGPHPDSAVSVLRKVSINTVFVRYHFSSRLWSWFTRRTRGCVPMSWNTFIHKILRHFLWTFWQITQRVSPYGLVVSISVWFFVFCWSMRRVSSYFLTHTFTSCWCGMQCKSNGILQNWCRRCRYSWTWRACR